MAYTDREDLNYLGILYGVGKDQTQTGVYTPFLSAIGGLQGGKAATTSNFTFPLAQTSSLTAASQDTQSEATSRAAGTPTTTTRAQDVNVCQIMKNDRAVTYAKQSAIGEISGATAQNGVNPVTDELGFQKMYGLMQIAANTEYSFLNGAYVASSGAATNQTTRGLTNAISTNAVAAGSVDLSKALIDSMIRTMAGNTVLSSNMLFLGNALQVQRLGDIYGFAPEDRTVGGVQVRRVYTALTAFDVMYSPHMPADEVFLVNPNIVRPMFCPHKVGNNGSLQLISWTDTAIVAAEAGGFWYTQLGLDYGAEEYHGSITGLTTS